MSLHTQELRDEVITCLRCPGLTPFLSLSRAYSRTGKWKFYFAYAHRFAEALGRRSTDLSLSLACM